MLENALQKHFFKKIYNLTIYLNILSKLFTTKKN
jgi:hypothetical protein